MPADREHEPRREPSYAEWLAAQADVIGTHYDGCFRHHPACAAIEGEKAATERLKSLITDGHNLRLLLGRIESARYANDDDDLDGSIGSIPSYCHEWEKRAQRAGVDWWNRKGELPSSGEHQEATNAT